MYRDSHILRSYKLLVLQEGIIAPLIINYKKFYNKTSRLHQYEVSHAKTPSV